MKRKQEQEKRNRRLILAVLMMFLTLMVCTLSTYAWFSANTAVTTTGIDVKVTASTGISISANALDFSKTTSMDEVIAFAKDETFASTLQLPEEISPVSTVGIKGGNSFQFYNGLLGEQNVVKLQASRETHDFLTTAGKENFTNGEYIAFDVYLRSSLDQTLKLNDATSITIRDGVEGGILANLQSALRIGFVNLGSTKNDNQAEATALNKVKDWRIYNPYPYLHHSSSLKSGYSGTDNEDTVGYYAAADSTDNIVGYNSLGEVANEADVDKGFIKFLHNDVPSDPNTAGILELMGPANSKYLQAQSADDILPTDNLIDINAGITKLRIYVWLEGNDIDCVDAISISDGLTINLGFEIV